MSDMFLATTVNPANQTQSPPPLPGQTYFFGSSSNDLIIGVNNDFTLVSGLALTTQDVQKILMTEQGTNFVFPLYGTTLQDYIGTDININSISGQVQTQITTALQILYLLTQNRSNPQEIVQTLYSLSTNLQNETTVTALLTVISASNQEITTGISISSI